MTETYIGMILAGISAGILGVGSVCRAEEPASEATVRQERRDLRLDLFPVHGSLVAKRQATFVAGELMNFATKISGLSTASDGQYDCDWEYSFTDSSSKAVVRRSGKVKELFLGGNEFTGSFSIESNSSVSPRQCLLQFRVRDNVTGQTAEKKCPVTILDTKRFTLQGLSQFHDRDELHEAGSNITAGETIHVRCFLHVPVNANGEARAKASVTVYDRHGNPVDKHAVNGLSQSDVGGSVARFFIKCKYVFSDQEIGLYRIHIEAKDAFAGTTDQCDCPLLVHSSPRVPLVLDNTAAHTRQEVAQPPASSAIKEERQLSVEVHPTLGFLGRPCGPHFALGEKASLTVTIRGLSTDEKAMADYSLATSVLGSDSSILWSDTHEERTTFFSKNRSLVVPLGLGTGPLAKPGRYTGRFQVRDKVANKSASKDITILFHDDKLALSTFALCCDEEGQVLIGPNLTVGETVYTRNTVFLPKKSQGHDVELVTFVLDENGREINRIATRSDDTVKFLMDRSQFVLASTRFIVNRPGSFFLRHELKDLVTKETVAREVPFNVFPPAELVRVQNRQGSKSSGVRVQNYATRK